MCELAQYIMKLAYFNLQKELAGEVEGAKKKISKQQGLLSSNKMVSKQQAHKDCQLHTIGQHATGKGSSNEQTSYPKWLPKMSFLCNQRVKKKKEANNSTS